MRSRFFKLILPSLGALVAVVAFVRCDSTARIFLRLVQFDELQVVSATPVKKVTVTGPDGQPRTIWRPACDGGAEGVKVAFNLRSTQRQGSEGDIEDGDRQIRPSEDPIGKALVKMGKTVSAQDFALEMTCASPLGPQDNPGACPGQANPTNAAIDPKIDFVDHLEGQGRHSPIGVAILIDQSGSTSGLVDRDTCLEGKPGSFDTPSNLETCQSDQKSLRIAAASNIINSLNPEDNVIVFAFNEDGCHPVCNLVEGVDFSDEQKLANCYGTDRGSVLGGDGRKSALGELQGKGAGRSNLWTCYEQVWSFMASKGEVARHLITITDGPDTCSLDSEDFQHCFQYDDAALGGAAQEACPGVRPYTQVRDTIEQSLEQGTHLHASFIQFQAPGYPNADTRMQEMACLTGGHYQFLNFNAIAKAGDGRRTAILAAAERLRLTLGGYWDYIVDIPTFTGDPAASAANLKRGDVYSLEGTLRMAANGLTNLESQAHFAWGGVDPNESDRLPIRKACTSDSDCAGAGGECGVRCSPNTRTCVPPADGSPCEGGVCCEGACMAGQTLCTSDQKGTPGNPGVCP